MNLVDELRKELQECLKDMVLPVKRKYQVEGQQYRPIEVHQYGMRDPDEEPYIPYALVQHLNGKDQHDPETGERVSTAHLRIVVTIYEQDENEGMKALENIMQRIRMHLWRKTTLCERYQLTELEYVMIPDNSEKYYLGDIMTLWIVPPISRMIQGLHGWN